MKKEMNNKGFSLVELIIVVAIMAVLVGVLAPQYIKYLDKSKVGVDQQMVDNLRQAMVTTYLDPNVKNGFSASAAGQSLGTDGTGEKFWTEVYGIMGVTNASGVQGLLTLDSTGTITYDVDVAKGTFTVKVSGGKYANYPIEVE